MEARHPRQAASLSFRPGVNATFSEAFPRAQSQFSFRALLKKLSYNGVAKDVILASGYALSLSSFSWKSTLQIWHSAQHIEGTPSIFVE